MAIGRNEPCPCGSRLKYKNCCADKSRRGVSKGLIALLVAIGLIAAVGVVGTFNDRQKSPAPVNAPVPGAGANPMQPGKPQPPGPTPPGKVWDAAHGHWHDAGSAPGASPVQITPGAAPGTTPINITPGTARGATPQAPLNAPQPDGPAPPGKVWSREHGHWHDAPKQ